jgi:5'-nucleotidase
MAHISLDNKIVIAISSSALFDLDDSDRVYREKGNTAYRVYQRENQKKLLPEGIAFPFIKKLFGLNRVYPDIQPVEVVLLSRNDPDTGLRVFHSIKEYGLPIIRAGFLNGKAPYSYLPAFNACLFLSANPEDVRQAITAGYPAGTVLGKSKTTGEPLASSDNSPELRLAFDFDGVLADDQAESVYQKNRNLDDFQKEETLMAREPHNPGPLKNLFQRLSDLQKFEQESVAAGLVSERILRTAIITARSAPAHERVVTTLREWGVSADETFFLGGINKNRILEIFKPHIFFDDQMTHLTQSANAVPSVHIPFGIVNQR